MTTELCRCMEALESGIAANEKEVNPIKRISLNLVLTENILRNVETHMDKDHKYLGEVMTTIRYHKEYLPPFIAKWVFFKKCHELETCRLYSTPAKFQAHCEEELSKVHEFFDKNRRFCQIYYGEDVELYRLLFLEEEPHEILEFPIPFPFKGINNGCLKASYLLAYEQYGTLLKQELSLDRISSKITEEKPPKTNATATDWVELGLALHATVVFPSCTQEAIMDRIRRLSGMPLEHWEQLGANVRKRKSGLEFLDRLKANLAARNKEIEDEGRARRRPNAG